MVFQHHPRTTEFFERGETVWALAFLGFDLNMPREYSVLITLAPMPAGDKELTFCMIVTDGETGEESTYWSGKDVARLLPADARRLVMLAIRAAVAELVDRYRPARVFMCTVDENLPEAALRKHLAIVDVFRARGYKVEEGEPMYGRMSWWVERDGSPVD